MGHRVVLLCFLWQARQSKRLFSSCPHDPECRNINLSHRIWFLPRTASTQQRSQYSKSPSRFWSLLVTSLLSMSKWPWGSDGLNIPYLGQCYMMCGAGTPCHFFLHMTVMMKGGPTCSDQDQKNKKPKKKSSVTPTAPVRFLEAVLWDRITTSICYCIIPVLFIQIWKLREGCKIIHALLTPNCA